MAKVTLSPGLNAACSVLPFRFLCSLLSPAWQSSCAPVCVTAAGHLHHTTPAFERGKKYKGKSFYLCNGLSPAAARAARSTFLLALPRAITLLGLTASCRAMRSFPSTCLSGPCLFPGHSWNYHRDWLLAGLERSDQWTQSCSRGWPVLVRLGVGELGVAQSALRGTGGVIRHRSATPAGPPRTWRLGARHHQPRHGGENRCVLCHSPRWRQGNTHH